MDYLSYYDSPIGKLTLITNEESLLELRFANHLIEVNDDYLVKDDLEIIKKTKRWLDRYFNKMKPDFSEIKLLVKGSDFQLKVWELLCEIPYGETLTYKDIARKISLAMSPQAIGGAVGKNPIGIIIPCHRVIGKNHKLVGFGGGLETKKWLLNHEDNKKI